MVVKVHSSIMFGLFSTISSVRQLGLREYVRQRFKLPLYKFIHNTVDLYKTRTKKGVRNVRDILFKGTIVAVITALIIWLAIFMYFAFYYAYVPSIAHERQVYLKFRPCDKAYSATKGVCSFPSAHVELTKKQQLLMMGQPYKIYLHLEMPESPTNKNLGMFMICADFHGRDGSVIANSCRSTMLHYKGFLLDTLFKLVYSPLYLLGNSEEKQHIRVELFSDYQEANIPVTDVFLEIQSMHIEIYTAKLLINAHFTGLRYLMYNWPVFSAAIGVTSNLFFIAFMCLISWYQIIQSDEYKNLNTDKQALAVSKDFESDSFDDETSLLEEENILKFEEGQTEQTIENVEDTTDC